VGGLEGEGGGTDEGKWVAEETQTGGEGNRRRQRRQRRDARFVLCVHLSYRDQKEKLSQPSLNFLSSLVFPDSNYSLPLLT